MASIILVANNTGDGKSIGYDVVAVVPRAVANCFFLAASTTARVVGSIVSVAKINSVGDKSFKFLLLLLLFIVLDDDDDVADSTRLVVVGAALVVVDSSDCSGCSVMKYFL